MVSFCFPQLVEVKAFKIFNVLPAFSLVFAICSLNFSLGSKVSPKTLGCLTVGIRVLFM